MNELVEDGLSLDARQRLLLDLVQRHVPVSNEESSVRWNSDDHSLLALDHDDATVRQQNIQRHLLHACESRRKITVDESEYYLYSQRLSF